MKHVFLETENVRRFRAALDELNALGRHDSKLCLVQGPSGSGKSTCARRYARRFGALYVGLEEWWTPRTLLAALCGRVRRTPPGSLEGCRRFLYEALKEGPRPVLADGVHLIRGIGMVEHLRDLHDVAGVPVVLIGESSFCSLIEPHRRIWSRISLTLELMAIGRDEVRRLGSEAAGLVIEPLAAEGMVRRCGANLRRLWKDMEGLELLAKHMGTRTVTGEMVGRLG